MTMANLIPTLGDAELANLLANARRLQSGSGASQAKAEALVPLIEAELAEREARKPAKPAPKARKPAGKVKVEA
jgi:hypothetical protein